MQAAACVTGGAILSACKIGTNDAVPTIDPETQPTALLESVVGYTDPQRWAGRQITVTSPGDDGGEYQTAQINAIIEPFQRLTGAEVRTARTDIAEIQRQVNTGEVEWSVCDIEASEVLPLANGAILQELDYSRIDSTYLFKPLVFDHGVAAGLYATALSYRKDLLDNTPQTWTDFWNLNNFPGLRGLQENPVGTFEFALLAGGVALDALYPLDVERAFQMLGRIRESILVWWRQGAQATQTIASGDVSMVSAWHNRILELQAEGAAVELNWNQAAINGDAWVIPNGAPESDVAVDFVNFATRPEVCAAFSQAFPFGPANSQAWDFLDPQLADQLPGGPNIPGDQFTIDFEWWFRNQETIQERFDLWLEEAPAG